MILLFYEEYRPVLDRRGEGDPDDELALAKALPVLPAECCNVAEALQLREGGGYHGPDEAH